MARLKILFASSEAQPLIKTGGLADVSGALPVALNKEGHDARLILPAYPGTRDHVSNAEVIAELDLLGAREPVRIIEAQTSAGLVTYLVDSPEYFRRTGNPYVNEAGVDWPDNPARFTLFCRAIAVMALGLADGNWKPDVVHCNDWQTGLVPALLSLQSERPATVFTIHNLSYQGNYPRTVFDELKLPEALWVADGLEYYGNLSFIKGGIAYADKINTVSPTYRNEVLTPEFGYGLEGALKYRETDFHGILNGADYGEWSPLTDTRITRNYSSANFSLAKPDNKKELQKSFNLPLNVNTPLIGMVGRLVEQKGVDLILSALPDLMAMDVQLAILGSGDRELEQQLKTAHAKWPDKFGLEIGYSEPLSHLLEAGADMFLMPSRFEPCGLNQIYSLRYGTIPIVRKTGGLADSVTDASQSCLANATASGFVFDEADAAQMLDAIKRALELFRDRAAWRQLVRTAMQLDFSWEKSALDYVPLYEDAIRKHRPAGSPAELAESGVPAGSD